MTKLLSLLFIGLFCMAGYGWYPVHSKNEFRLIASGPVQHLKEPSKLGKLWNIEGQLVSLHAAENLKIGGLFSKGHEDSSIGAHVTYSFNKYIDLTVTGGLKSIKSLGGTFIVSGNYSPLPRVLLKPFLKVDHKQVGEFGSLVYLKAEDNIWFHLGLGYSPKLRSGLPLNQHASNKLAVIAGVSFNRSDFAKTLRAVVPEPKGKETKGQHLEKELEKKLESIL